MKELQIVKQVLPEIVFNFEEIKKSISEITAEYKNLVVTAETLPGCKKSQKELAHMRIEITKEGKRIEKIMVEPIKRFKTEVKEVVGLVTDVENPIKEGLAIFDEQRRQEKLKSIEGLRDKLVVVYGIKPGYLEQIVIHDRLLNVTASMAEIKGSLETQVATLAEKQKRHEANKQMVKDLIVTLNKLHELNMKLEDFDLYFPNDWDEVSGLVATINNYVSQQKQEKEREQEVLEAEMKAKPVEVEPEREPEPVEPTITMKAHLSTDTDWELVSKLMSMYISLNEGGSPEYWQKHFTEKAMEVQNEI